MGTLVYSNIDDLIAGREDFTIPQYLRDKLDIIDFFHDEYGDLWRRQIIAFCQEYSDASYDTIRRRFSGGRENRAPRSQKDKAIWVDLGKNLPVQSYKPNGSITIGFLGYVQISNTCEEREFEESLSEVEAFDLINNDDLSFDDIMDLYFPSGLVSGPCGDYEIDITFVEVTI